jgi:hypothetical protein
LNSYITVVCDGALLLSFGRSRGHLIRSVSSRQTHQMKCDADQQMHQQTDQHRPLQPSRHDRIENPQQDEQ